MTIASKDIQPGRAYQDDINHRYKFLCLKCEKREGLIWITWLSLNGKHRGKIWEPSSYTSSGLYALTPIEELAD